MLLESLRVLNLSKARALPAGFDTAALLPCAFRLDSCQRLLWICQAEDLGVSTIPNEIEIRSGKTAYEFLLRVATGLESEIVGETDIFGQLKEAWKKFSAQGGAPVHELGAWIQKVFEDTKDIRTLYLQNQGGISYGSLVRKLLPEKMKSPVLLVGGGQLACSVAPYLAENGLLLMNRTREKLESLCEELNARGTADVSIVTDEAEALREADTVVVCVPFDPASDAGRIDLLMKGSEEKRIIHLGGHRHDSGRWGELRGALFLDDVFALQKSQSEVRSTQVSRAARACETRSKLRSLGASVSIPHGWEDLAAFA